MNQSDSISSEEQAESSVAGTMVYGIFLALFGGLVLYFSKDIRAFSLGNSDPGPRTIPMAMGAIMFCGGIWQIGIAVWRYKHRNAPSEQDRRSSLTERLSQRVNRRVLATFAILLTYLVLLPLAGFALSTILFVIGLLKLLKSSWIESVVASVAVVALIHVMFTTLFRVSLPAGSLMPF